MAFLLISSLNSSLFAMGVAPPQTFEVGVPNLTYVNDFGFSGSGGGQFYFPQDVCISTIGDISTSLGNIFIADTGNNRIQRIDKDGSFQYQFGKFGSGSGQFNTPSSIAVDFNYYIYVVDQENSRVQKFDIRGNFVKSWGSFGKETGKFENPKGITIDYAGNIYVADSGNDRIQKFDGEGNYLSTIGGFGIGDGFFDNPMDIAVDREKNIYIADTNNNRIQKLDEYGKPILSIGGFGQFSKPSGIAVDYNYIYVADSGNNRLQIFDKKGNLLSTFGKKGYQEGEFNNPMGISTGKNGDIFIADTNNHRIVKLKTIYK
ncbi:MAG: Tripartite motif-containing protein 71 [Candidatus Saganbacteria bacterium]|uniref:Tripartite motif-containing protein 71 n=1 Tax=Candidatus Saganbacteria bacterium TaxID=2575572 RepID=A0A833L210_UNCSA|nr:MAG: Tripartite motif-containing protein 71 [Candidatus Saganbacteria bacterium]